MIKINLATRKQASLGAAAGPKVDVDVAALAKDPVIRRFILLLIVLFGGNYVLGDYQEKQLQELTVKVEQARAESIRLKKETEELRNYELVKKELEADELLIRTKLEVLRKLVSERSSPPKMLIALAEAITEESWITNLVIEETGITVSGGSTDFNRISDIIRKLGESTYYRDITLKDSEQKQEGGTAIAVFTLSTKQGK